jgi:DNA-binding NtrC family response regulator
MARPSLSSDDRTFLGHVGRAIFMNVFADERETLLRALLPGHRNDVSQPDTTLDAFLEQVNARIARIDAGRLRTLGDFASGDRDVMRNVLLYQIYHRFLPDLDDLIRTQIQHGGDPVPVPFAEALLDALGARGFVEEERLRYLAIFYQLRRAFFFIVVALIGDSASMKQLRRELWNVVFTHDMRTYDRCLWNRMEDFSTLLLGETGTGKGSAAAAIGRSGLIPFDRQRGRFATSFVSAFVPINLSQYPETLLESELFGHKKGAFTGAIQDYAGVFEICSEYGTLFLDEIGEATTPTQIKLLQVLQERSFTPLGTHAKKRFAGRVVGATNRRLESLRADGALRDDFYYRLCSELVVVPPLRQRIDESPRELAQLVESLVTRIAGEPSAELTGRILENLRRDLPARYRWPGNVRELEQAVRRMLLSGRYGGDFAAPSQDADDLLVHDLRSQTLDARQLLQRYCAMIYRREGTFEAVARRTRLDRRTARKYALAGTGR